MKTHIDDIVSPHVKDRIAWTGALEFSGATEDDRTGRTVQFRIMRDGVELLDAHPFARYTRRRRGHAGTRFNAVFSPIGGGDTIEGEVMLLNWADGPRGATVKFLLNPATETFDGAHPFMFSKRRAGDTPADTFMGVLMELDDDDAVINQAKRERFEKAQQKLSNVAAMMVKYPRFQEWVREMLGDRPEAFKVVDDKTADRWLKGYLDISSKAELDGKNAAAQHRFLKLRATYVEWLDANKYSED